MLNIFFSNNWTEYIEVVTKTIIFYFVLILIMRLMGKREVGELSVFDIVVFFVISELVSLAINEPGFNLLKSLFPIFLIVLLEYLTSLCSLKKLFVRNLVEGVGTLIINNGKIDQSAMRKERYTIDDLMSQLRSKQVDSPSLVQFATLEINGQLTIIKKCDATVLHPNPIISDGIIDYKVLNQINKDEIWLSQELRKLGHINIESIFLCIYEEKGLYVVSKQV